MTSNPNELVLKVIEIAAKQFKAHMYDDCVRLFTRGIDYIHSLDQNAIKKIRSSYKLNERPSYLGPNEKINHPKLVTMLDSRAASFEKLGKLNEALNDCLEIIKVEPYNIKGYLRCGKIYQLMKKDRKAFEIYVTGIKKIDQGIEKFKLKINLDMLNHLKHVRSQLKIKILNDEETERLNNEKKRQLKHEVVPIPQQTIKKIKPNPKSFDFFQKMPFEINEKIFKLLTLKQIFSCSLVNKEWNKSIGKMRLYNNITMNKLIGLTEVKNCHSIIRNSKRNQSIKLIQTFKLNSIRRPEEKQVLIYLLTKFGISITNNLTLNFLDITIEQIVDILSSSSAARKVVSQLKSINLKCVFVPTVEETLLSYLPNLESIQLIPSPSSNNFSQGIPINYEPPTTPFSNLKSLYIVGNKQQQKKQQLPFQFFFQKDSLVPNLKSLIIVGCNFQYLNQRNENFNFLVNFNNLETLIFENNHDYNFRDFFKNHDLLEFPNLKKFVLRQNKIDTTESLFQFDPFYIEKIFGNLTVLDLTSSSIDYIGLKKILKICGNSLKQLSIGLCSHIIHPPEIITNLDYIPFNYEEFIHLCPLLEVLYLNQSTEFSDHCLTKFIDAIRKYDLMKHLKVLDLSFNGGLSGYKLIEFVKLRKLKLFILDGILNIQPGTIKFMENQHLVDKVVARADRVDWRQYGTTSYDPFL